MTQCGKFRFGIISLLLAAFAGTLPGCIRNVKAVSADGPLAFEPLVVQFESLHAPAEDRQLKVTNVSGAVLNVATASTSCGCVSLLGFVPAKLIPGQSMELAVKVSPRGYGSVINTVRLTLNGHRQTDVAIPVTAVGPTISAPFISRLPAEIGVQFVGEDTTAETNIDIQTVETIGSALWLKTLAAPADLRLVSLDLVSESRIDTSDNVLRVYRATVSCSLVAEESQKILVATPGVDPPGTKGDQPIAIRLVRERPYQLHPERLLLKLSDAMPKYFAISSVTESPPTVVRVSSSDDIVKVRKLDTHQTSTRYEVSLARDTQETSGKKVEIEVVLDDPRTVLRLPVRIAR